MSVKYVIEQKNTSSAAFLMNAFAGSDQIAGTVTTHWMSVSSMSISCLHTQSKTDCFRYLRDSENTTIAGNDFPVSSSIKTSWSPDWIKTVYVAYYITNKNYQHI